MLLLGTPRLKPVAGLTTSKRNDRPRDLLKGWGGMGIALHYSPLMIHLTKFNRLIVGFFETIARVFASREQENRCPENHNGIIRFLILSDPPATSGNLEPSLPASP